jgi:hypothetical protein
MSWEVARLAACDTLKGAAANNGTRRKTLYARSLVLGKRTANAAPLGVMDSFLSLHRLCDYAVLDCRDCTEAATEGRCIRDLCQMACLT